jgi:hypothetical protein
MDAKSGGSEMKKPTLKEWMKHAEKSKPRKQPKLDTLITIRVPMTKKEVTAYVGKPCKDYEAGCPACDAWKEWHSNYGYVFEQVNRAEMVSLMIRGKL